MRLVILSELPESILLQLQLPANRWLALIYGDHEGTLALLIPENIGDSLRKSYLPTAVHWCWSTGGKPSWTRSSQPWAPIAASDTFHTSSHHFRPETCLCY